MCLVKLNSRHHEHQNDTTCVQVVALSNICPASVFSCTLAQMLLQQHARCEVRAVVYSLRTLFRLVCVRLAEASLSARWYLHAPFPPTGTNTEQRTRFWRTGYADVGPREKGGGADVGGVSRLRQSQFRECVTCPSRFSEAAGRYPGPGAAGRCVCRTAA